MHSASAARGGWFSQVAIHLPLERCIADAQVVGRARTFMAAPRNAGDYAWGQHLIDTGAAFLLPHLEAAQFRTMVTPDIADIYETIGIHSMLVVALRLRGKSMGTLALFRFDPASPPFDEGDQEMAQALADHAALAIANGRSYAADRATRDAAMRAEAEAHEHARKLQVLAAASQSFARASRELDTITTAAARARSSSATDASWSS